MALGDGAEASTGGSFGTSDEEFDAFIAKMDALEAQGLAADRYPKPVAGSKIPDPGFGGHTNDAMLKNKVGDIVITQHTVMTTATYKEPVAATWKTDAIAGGWGQQVSDETTLETWTLKNAWIKSINFGTLDYSSDELITIEVVISYDWCEVEFPAMSSVFQ